MGLMREDIMTLAEESERLEHSLMDLEEGITEDIVSIREELAGLKEYNAKLEIQLKELRDKLTFIQLTPTVQYCPPPVYVYQPPPYYYYQTYSSTPFSISSGSYST